MTASASVPHETPGRSLIAPYVTAWSGEKDPPYAVVERPGGGIAYLDESFTDRDRNGVLWFRTPFQQGQGRPEFGRVHPLRQRRTMLRLLCQVCAGPADRTDDGVLWLLQDHQEDWDIMAGGYGRDRTADLPGLCSNVGTDLSRAQAKCCGRPRPGLPSRRGTRDSLQRLSAGRSWRGVRALG